MRLSGIRQSSLKAWKIFWTSNFIMKLTDKGLITPTKIYKNSFHQCWHMLYNDNSNFFFALLFRGEKKNKNLPRDRIEERMKEKVKTVQFINHIQFFEARWIKIKGIKHFLQTTALRYYFGKNIPPILFWICNWVADYYIAKSSARSTTIISD